MTSSSVLARNIQAARKNHQPLFGTFEITQKCNLRCKHCYNFDRNGPPVSRSELSKDEIFQTLDSLAMLGVLSLNISGGEPLLHPHIYEILAYAKGLNFHLRVKSNGTLIDSSTAKKLKDSGVKEIDISLYGADEDSYLAFSGKKGLLRALKSMEHCKALGIQVNVSIILHRYNYRDLKNMITLLEEREIHYFVSDEITDRYDGTQAREHYALEETHYKELLEGPFRYFFDHHNPEKNVMCGCAKSVIGINAYGEVLPCIGAPLISGNIRTQKLETIWKESPTLNRIRALEFSDFKDCASCSLLNRCSRSSGSAYINTGQYTGCDPVAFTHAKARRSLE